MSDNTEFLSPKLVRSLAGEVQRLHRLSSLDDVYLEALQLTLDVLQLEHSRIAVAKEGTFVHAWGMDLDQNITDERGLEKPVPGELRQVVLAGFSDLYTIVEDAELLATVDGTCQPVGRGWMACTPIYSTQKEVIALLLNDTPISKAPVDPQQQLTVALFCAHLESVIERVATQERLDRTASLYQHLLHNLPAVTYVMELGTPREDPTQHKVIYISPQVKNILGRSQAEWLADPGLEFKILHPDDRQRVLRDRWQAHTAMKNVSMEYRILHPDGREIWIRNQIVHLDPGSTPTHPRIQGCMFDITQEKQAVEEKKALEAKLDEAARMESIGLLTGCAAHDLNNILGPVMGYPDLLLDEIPNLGERMKKDLEAIKDSTREAADLIQDLLNLARPEHCEHALIDINQQIETLLGSASFGSILLHHPHITIHQNIGKNPLYIEASIPHLAKLLKNLIFNASESMGGRGQIRISTSEEITTKPFGSVEKITPGKYVCLCIDDEGPGLEMKSVSQIFEPFYTTKTLGHSGTGLGLAVVRGLVKDFFGYIDVTPNASGGTRFSIYLPARKKNLPEASDEPILPRGEGRILVVDDVPAQRTLAERLLTRLGYQTDYAVDGEDALEHFRKGGRPNVVMLDMVMKEGLDGLDTYRAILEIVPDQKCLITSGFSSNERVQEATKLGAGMFINKPYSLQKLDLALRRVLYS